VIVIYIDVYFLINFCVDYIALQMTCSLFCKKPDFSRLVISAVFGGITSVFLFFADTVLLSVLVLPLSSHVMCKCVIERSGINQVAAFWCTSIFTGGFIEAVEGIIKNKMSPTATLIIILPLCALAHIMLKKAHRSIKRSFLTRSVDACIYFGTAGVRVSLLIDSGNLALEPVTGKRIIILGERAGRLFSIPDKTEKYPVYLKSATGEACEYAYAPDKIIFDSDVVPEEFLVLINSSCDNFAGFDGLAPTVKMR